MPMQGTRYSKMDNCGVSGSEKRYFNAVCVYKLLLALSFKLCYIPRRLVMNFFVKTAVGIGKKAMSQIVRYFK